MTIKKNSKNMDYEKKYKDAVRIAKSFYEGEAVSFLGTIFPELAESEDEKAIKLIRSLLVNARNVQSNTSLYKQYDDALAWLEKQKDNKFALRVLPCSAAWFEDGDEKQKEQKSADKPKWDDSDMREDENELQTRFAFYTYKDDSTVLYLSNVFVEEASRNHGFGTKILKAAEKVAETIGASSICLKVKQNTPANAWYRKRGYGYVAFEDGYDWLEKNLEYMKPTKSAEWSEEDKRAINRACVALRAYANGELPEFLPSELIGCADRLQSLRPSWKPSKEQMEALDTVSGT